MCAVLEICKYQRHVQVYWKNSNVVGNCLMQTIILSYYFWEKCIGYFVMLPNTFSHRPPLNLLIVLKNVGIV